MSSSDETAPAEEVTPEPESDAGTWSEADSAAVDAAAGEAGAGAGADAPDGADGGAGEDVDPLTAMTRERDEYLLALQRTQADFENYRKRIARLQEEQSARASSDLVAKLLPVLDTLDLAQAHQSEASADSEDAKALTASRAMLLDLLAKQGLARVDEAEVPFDPAIHDAVARSEDESASGEVVIDEVLRSGYVWKGQVLRPAMVRVRG